MTGGATVVEAGGGGWRQQRRRRRGWKPGPDVKVGGGGVEESEEEIVVLRLRAKNSGQAVPQDPFAVGEALQKALGETGGTLESAQPEGDGYALVVTAAQKELLVQKLTKFGELEVVVEEHPTRNRVRCVVRCPETNGTPTQRLEEELAKLMSVDE